MVPLAAFSSNAMYPDSSRPKSMTISVSIPWITGNKAASAPAVTACCKDDVMGWGTSHFFQMQEVKTSFRFTNCSAIG
ncbi:hypothetical protein D3C73_1524930 [compost metagenome]